MDDQITGGSGGYAGGGGHQNFQTDHPLGAPSLGLSGSGGRQDLQAEACLPLGAPFVTGYGDRIPIHRLVQSGSSVTMVRACNLPAASRRGTGVFFIEPNMGDQVPGSGVGGGAGHFLVARGRGGVHGGHGVVRGRGRAREGRAGTVVVVDDVVGAELIGNDLLQTINNPTPDVDDVVGAELIGNDLLQTINNPTPDVDDVIGVELIGNDLLQAINNPAS